MKSVVESQNIVVLKADMTEESPTIDAKLLEFGNTLKAIPYYAVYRPSEDPHHFAGNFTVGGAKEFLDTAGISYSETPTENRDNSDNKLKPDAGVVADARLTPAR